MTGKCLTSIFILPLCFEIQFPCYYYEIYVFFPQKPLNGNAKDSGSYCSNAAGGHKIGGNWSYMAVAESKSFCIANIHSP